MTLTPQSTSIAISICYSGLPPSRQYRKYVKVKRDYERAFNQDLDVKRSLCAIAVLTSDHQAELSFWAACSDVGLFTH